MKVIYVARTFLDYRIPVFLELSKKSGIDFRLVYSVENTPQNVQSKAKSILGESLIGLSGEKKIMFGSPSKNLSNKWLRIPYQPGLLNVLKRENPDVVIGDGFFQWTFVLVLIRILYKIPLVICYERTEHTEREAQWYRKYYRKIVIKITSAISCSGKLCKAYTEKLGMAPHLITTGHMVVDVFHFSVKSQSIELFNTNKPKLDCVKFLYVGGLIDKKGLKQLFNSWATCMKKYENDVSLTIVGEGYLKDELLNFCKLNRIKNIIFMGRIENDLLPNVYRASDIFIIPTLEDNWSLVVPEAMASGLPICTSKYNGCWPELVEANVNGWVFDPLNAIEFKNTLESIYLSKKKLKVMGRESERIIAKYSPQTAAKAILDAVNIAVFKKK